MLDAQLSVHSLTEQREDEWPLGAELTASLFDTARAYCDSEGGCHGPDHIERVHNTAIYIGRQMNADLIVLSAAALLHDIGRQLETAERGNVCHAAIGSNLARDLLARHTFSPAQINAITSCIASHRYRGDAVPSSLEEKILYDADKLDSIGAIGIGRAFLFAGQIGARLHNRDNTIEGTESYSVDDTAYREFRVKMCSIKDRMLTPVGKRLAIERHAFMETFFNRLDHEIGRNKAIPGQMLPSC
jgi:uncharacterized protein